MSKGLFITLEGVEGAGKTTQQRLLADWLAGLGLSCLQTREPGAGQIGAQIRAVLLNPANTALTPTAEALLMAADRAQHAEEALRPALNAGQVVLCDRYIDSHMAYQGYGRGLSVAWLRQLNEQATGGLWPDMTLLLDMPVSQGLARAKSRGAADRMEQEQVAFHQRIYDGYMAIWQAEPERVRRIDACKPVAAVQNDIRAAVGKLLVQKGLVSADALR